VIPLVANFTDDNKDGLINLCDIPDVIIVTSEGTMRMLAGNTGEEELEFQAPVDFAVTPALGDLDGDKIPEVVTHADDGAIIAFRHDGSILWKGPIGAYASQPNSFCEAVGLFDLDADGHPEIVSGFEVYDNKGNRKFAHDVSAWTGHYWCPSNTAADLDGDGTLEVIMGNTAYHADGSKYWSIPGPPGQPQVANLDADPEPEIFIAREDGILVLENDGTIKLGPVRLTGEPTNPNCWSKPGAIGDFDGDGIAEISASTCTRYGMYKLNGSTLSLAWSQSINDYSGLSSTTAFDFLGRGSAEAVYTDMVALYVFDGKAGTPLFNESRTSRTLIEFPIVVDVDNDRSADIIVISNGSGSFGPSIQVWQDAQHRWIPTRRIWNQHAYSVANVREDGTIPKTMPKSWLGLNTFRTNAQVEGNASCKPQPQPN
jgi:hypothetical protein